LSTKPITANKQRDQIRLFATNFFRCLEDVADVHLETHSSTLRSDVGFSSEDGVWLYVDFHGTRYISLGVLIPQDTFNALSKHINHTGISDNELTYHALKEVINTAGGQLTSSLQTDTDVLTMRSPGLVDGGRLRLAMVPFQQLIYKTSLGEFNFVISTDQARHELQRLYERSEALNETKSNFLSVMSHELRSPLNTILGFSNRGLKKMHKDSRYYWLMENVNNSGQQLLEIIDSVLDMATIENGTFSITLIQTDVALVVNRAIQHISGRIKEKPITLSFKNDLKSDEFILADQVRFQQMLTNLLSNAIKFTDAGEVNVLAQTLIMDNNQTWVSISVTDTGLGINKEDLGLLFIKFSQINTGANRNFEGSGLGLALTNELVKKHNGRIEVKSTPNVGSSFTLLFPLFKTA